MSSCSGVLVLVRPSISNQSFGTALQVCSFGQTEWSPGPWLFADPLKNFEHLSSFDSLSRLLCLDFLSSDFPGLILSIPQTSGRPQACDTLLVGLRKPDCHWRSASVG
ncbi:hypothetical protein RvY_17097 [Ramazzottius varieornatus]|uniref:Uncharacterized protein n=1 Tax=Ramazzottius varieornatus TaxID=947166 RepID=A0A1D1W1F5_RAMVA|nr:hypothetical protein RvY_17097 [Ramazzottius varieornatus]